MVHYLLYGKVRRVGQEEVEVIADQPVRLNRHGPRTEDVLPPVKPHRISGPIFVDHSLFDQAARSRKRLTSCPRMYLRYQSSSDRMRHSISS